MDRLPKKFEIRDTRNGDWAWVYKAVISDTHLSHVDVRVYSALAGFDGKDHSIFPSYETIAERASASRRSALESIKNLVRVGYVDIEKGGGRNISNKYNLLRKPKGCNLCTVSKRVQSVPLKGAKDVTERVQGLHPNKSLNKNNKKKGFSLKEIQNRERIVRVTKQKMGWL